MLTSEWQTESESPDISARMSCDTKPDGRVPRCSAQVRLMHNPINDTSGGIGGPARKHTAEEAAGAPEAWTAGNTTDNGDNGADLRSTATQLP